LCGFFSLKRKLPGSDLPIERFVRIAMIREAKLAGAGWIAAQGGAVAPKASSSAPKPPRGAQLEKTDQTVVTNFHRMRGASARDSLPSAFP
jgi:hypothetical protein